MIVNMTRTIAETRGITSPARLAERAGLLYPVAQRHWFGVTKLYDAATLEKLCVALQVDIGDLLVIEQEEPKREDA